MYLNGRPLAILYALINVLNFHWSGWGWFKWTPLNLPLSSMRFSFWLYGGILLIWTPLGPKDVYPDYSRIPLKGHPKLYFQTSPSSNFIIGVGANSTTLALAGPHFWLSYWNSMFPHGTRLPTIYAEDSCTIHNITFMYTQLILFFMGI